MKLLVKKKPDSRWLISLISTYLPTCEIFIKSYRPPKIDKEASMVTAQLIPNDDGLFDHADSLNMKNYKGIRTSLFLGKQEYLDYKIMLDRHRMEKLQEKMEAKQAKLIKLQNPVKT